MQCAKCIHIASKVVQVDRTSGNSGGGVANDR